jgi:hypothetical protein
VQEFFPQSLNVPETTGGQTKRKIGPAFSSFQSSQTMLLRQNTNAYSMIERKIERQRQREEEETKQKEKE